MEYLVLGPLEVRDGGRPLALGGAKQRALLALLLVSANRVVSRERLIDGLWGEEPPETAITTLQVYVSRLRKLLGSNALVTRPPGYLLAADPDSIDLERFERLLAVGREELTRGNPEPAARALGAALELWRGPALAEFTTEPFARIEGGRLDDLRIIAFEERIEADLALGRHADLIGELRALIIEHPHREHLREQLMLALYRSGRQSEALEVYRETRAALDELGIEPSERLRRLERSILSHDAALAKPQQLFSERPGLPGPLALEASSPFVGRERELSKLRSLVRCVEEGRAGRVALLGGAAGSGKTRLVRELARSAAERGMVVLYGGSDATAIAPYRPFVEALEFLVRVSDAEALESYLGEQRSELARLLPELGSVPLEVDGDAEAARRRLHAGVDGFLARVSAAHPLLVVVEDVHCSDAPSLQLLCDLVKDDVREAPTSARHIPEAQREHAAGIFRGAHVPWADRRRRSHWTPGSEPTGRGGVCAAIDQHGGCEQCVGCRECDVRPQ